MFKEQNIITNCMIREAKRAYYTRLIDSSSDTKVFFSVTNQLLGNMTKTVLPDYLAVDELLLKFSNYCVNKIQLIQGFSERCEKPVFDDLNIKRKFLDFKPVSVGQIKKLILTSPNKSNGLDPIPTYVLKALCEQLGPVISSTEQASLKEGHVPVNLKSALVVPLIKTIPRSQPAEELSTCVEFSFMSKILEKIVAEQLAEYLTNNVEKFQ